MVQIFLKSRTVRWAHIGAPRNPVRAVLNRIPAVKQALTRERLGIKLYTMQTIMEMPHTYKREVHDRRSAGRN